MIYNHSYIPQLLYIQWWTLRLVPYPFVNGTINIEEQVSIQCISVSLPPVIYLLIKPQVIWVFESVSFRNFHAFPIMTFIILPTLYESVHFFTSLPALCVWHVMFKTFYFIFSCVCGGWWLVRVCAGACGSEICALGLEYRWLWLGRHGCWD